MNKNLRTITISWEMLIIFNINMLIEQEQTQNLDLKKKKIICFFFHCSEPISGKNKIKYQGV